MDQSAYVIDILVQQYRNARAVGADTRWLIPIPVIVGTVPGPNFVNRLQ